MLLQTETTQAERLETAQRQWQECCQQISATRQALAMQEDEHLRDTVLPRLVNQSVELFEQFLTPFSRTENHKHIDQRRIKTMCLICEMKARYNLTDEEALNMFREFVRGAIGTTKKLTIAVDGPTPIAYTIGLSQNFELPELCIVGITYPDVASILLGIAADYMKDGRPARPGDVWELKADPKDPEAPRLRVRLKEIPENLYPENFGQAVAYYNSCRFRMLQLEWADCRDLLPGDPGVDPEIVKLQILGLSDQPELTPEEELKQRLAARMHACRN